MFFNSKDRSYTEWANPADYTVAMPNNPGYGISEESVLIRCKWLSLPRNSTTITLAYVLVN